MGFCIWRRDLWLIYLPLKTRWRSAGAICINCSVQFSSVIQFHSTLCNPLNCSTPGFPVHHQFPDLTKTPLHWVNDAIQPSHLLSSPSLPTFNLFSIRQSLFQWVSFFASCGQSIGVSASTSVLPMNIQDWYPLGLTGWISVRSKWL